MTDAIRLRYSDGNRTLAARVIYQWTRETLPGPVMSASSGPKDYVKNEVWTLFDADPAVDAVWMVRAGGPVFVIRRKGGKWFDVTGKQIDMKFAKDTQ